MQFARPDIATLSLARILHALSDPVRLATVRRLAECEGLSCTGGMPSETLPKATRSNHYKVLRESGLVETERRGREIINRLRRAEVDARFPGLLSAILEAA